MSAAIGFLTGLVLAAIGCVLLACWIEKPYRHWRTT